jgi:ABC-2 type transport system permease protein
MLSIITPIMAGMMTMYAFFTGTSTAESILQEEEERTLPRLFTTPTRQATILAGKFLAVFLTVGVQVSVLLTAGRLLFGIHWGDVRAVAMMALGLVVAASSIGLMICSFLRTRKAGGNVFGGVLTLSGMLGMIPVFAMNSPSAKSMAGSVSLLVPQGWVVRGLLQALKGEPLTSVMLSAGVLLIWGAAAFAIGVLRFNKRYA